MKNEGGIIDTSSTPAVGALVCLGGVMRIGKIKTSATRIAPFDLKAFSQELRELSNRYGVKLVSLGAMSGLDSGAKGTTYLAIWATDQEN